MNKKDFYKWLEENGMDISFSNCGGYPNDTMNFSRNGKWFFSARYSSDTDFTEVKEAILAELEGVHPQSINDIVTVSEVAELLSKNTSTIRKAIDKAITEGVLVEGKDYRKAKQVWLLTKLAVKKLYNDISWKKLDSIENPDRSGM